MANTSAKLDVATIEQQLLNEIESSIEDTRIPDAVAAHAAKRAGKPVTVKDAEQLEAQLGVPVRVSKRYGMTQVCWARGVAPNPWSDEGSILLSHSDTNVRWPDLATLHEKNPAYFKARDERNAQRQKLLAQHREAGCDRAADPSPIEEAAAAIVQLLAAQAKLAALTDYDRPLYVISFAIDRLVEK